jgi:hypothetical protein
MSPGHRMSGETLTQTPRCRDVKKRSAKIFYSGAAGRAMLSSPIDFSTDSRSMLGRCSVGRSRCPRAQTPIDASITSSWVMCPQRLSASLAGGTWGGSRAWWASCPSRIGTKG